MKSMTRVLLTGICCAAVLSGCGGKKDEPVTAAETLTETATTAEETEKEEETVAEIVKGDANKKAILVVSFGTSYNETRAKTIDAIEEKVAEAYPDYEVRRAFTSQMIIDKLKSRDGLEIDNVEQAMQRLVDDGFGTVIVHPTHVMSGIEFEEMLSQVDPFLDYFVNAITGEALLTYPDDFEALARTLIEDTADYNEEGTSIVFMGHGSEHQANEVYEKMEEAFAEEGYLNYFVGTVEAEPTLEDVMKKVEAAGSERVVLLPLMIVAGDHATNDMAGDEEDSWKTQFKAAGYEVECVLKGLGEYPAVQDLIVSHVQDSLDFLPKN